MAESNRLRGFTLESALMLGDAEAKFTRVLEPTGLGYGRTAVVALDRFTTQGGTRLSIHGDAEALRSLAAVLTEAADAIDQADATAAANTAAISGAWGGLVPLSSYTPGDGAEQSGPV